MGIYSLAFLPLKNGCIGCMPSDTIYGLSCVALNRTAVERIHSVKDRDLGKPFVILLAKLEQAKELGVAIKDLEPARAYWPGPLTLIAPSGKDTPEYLHRGLGTLAVRIPDNSELCGLIARVGPIVSTSANPQGQPPAKSVEEARRYFAGRLDFYIDAGPIDAKPSTIAKEVDGKLKILRRGGIDIN